MLYLQLNLQLISICNKWEIISFHYIPSHMSIYVLIFVCPFSPPLLQSLIETCFRFISLLLELLERPITQPQN